MSKGNKLDQDKPDYTLLPWASIEKVIEVLDYGAKKYSRDNWKHVENAEQRYLSAAFRHLSAHAQGEQTDQESGLSHLAHAACSLLFLLDQKPPQEKCKLVASKCPKCGFQPDFLGGTDIYREGCKCGISNGYNFHGRIGEWEQYIANVQDSIAPSPCPKCGHRPTFHKKDNYYANGCRCKYEGRATFFGQIADWEKLVAQLKTTT